LTEGSTKINTNYSNSDKTDKETLEFWERTLKYGTTGQKESVVNYIKYHEIKKGENLILRFIPREKDEKIKKLMISTLIASDNKKVLPFLFEIVKSAGDENDDMKIFAISSLGEMKCKDVNQYIIKNIDKENELLVKASIRTLGETGDISILEELLKRVQEEKRVNVRTELILALANIRSEKAENCLIGIFTNQEEKSIDRGYAATGLGYIKNKRSLALLTKYYYREEGNLKIRIIDSLGNIGFKEGIELLIESVKDDDKDIRIFGIRALGKLKAKEALDILKYKEEYDPEHKVRLEAKKALEKITGK